MPRWAGNENRKFCFLRDRVIIGAGGSIGSTGTSGRRRNRQARIVQSGCFSRAVLGVFIEEEVFFGPGWLRDA